MGVDLSRGSLGWASRQRARYGARNLRLLQGDILELPGSLEALGGTFHVLIASGVLHHLESPGAGLAALLACAARGALVRVALYSESARAGVVAARERVRAGGASPDPSAIRRARTGILEEIRGGGAASLEGLLASEDFYSASGFRDLVWHACEHRFRLREAVDLLKGAGLRWLGLEPPPGWDHAPGRERSIPAGEGDEEALVSAWERLEASEPGLFVQMYNLWALVP